MGRQEATLSRLVVVVPAVANSGGGERKLWGIPSGWILCRMDIPVKHQSLQHPPNHQPNHRSCLPLPTYRFPRSPPPRLHRQADELLLGRSPMQVPCHLQIPFRHRFRPSPTNLARPHPQYYRLRLQSQPTTRVHPPVSFW
jgi:hypothetical protein